MSGRDARRDLAVRIALGVWAVGWGWKAGFLIFQIGVRGLAIPIRYDGLPAILLNQEVALVAYLVPLLAAVVGVVRGGRAVVAAALVGCISAWVLVSHVATYNDATFVTAWWAGLWIAWAGSRTEAEARAWGPRLAQAVISLVFLGGVLGKLTPEYTSGEAMYQLYFVQKEVLLYPWLRETVPPDALRSLATAFSWAAIATEAALATSVLWKPRAALAVSAAVCLGMVAVSTPYLLSVMAPLVAMCAGGWVLADGVPGWWTRFQRSLSQAEPATEVAAPVGV